MGKWEIRDSHFPGSGYLLIAFQSYRWGSSMCVRDDWIHAPGELIIDITSPDKDGVNYGYRAVLTPEMVKRLLPYLETFARTGKLGGVGKKVNINREFKDK